MTSQNLEVSAKDLARWSICLLLKAGEAGSAPAYSDLTGRPIANYGTPQPKTNYLAGGAGFIVGAMPSNSLSLFEYKSIAARCFSTN